MLQINSIGLLGLFLAWSKVMNNYDVSWWVIGILIAFGQLPLYLHVSHKRKDD